MQPIPRTIKIGDKYGPAMTMTDQAEADAYFERLVQHGMEWGNERAEAERIERSNLGYYAGYFSHETRERVERLFRCAHPVFGSAAENGAPSPDQALKAGLEMGRRSASR